MNWFFRTLLVLLAIPSLSIGGQSVEQQETINRSAIFDAFNKHDVDRLMSMFTDDLEFYHDTGGLTNYQQSQESFKKMFASTPDIRRDLVKGSPEIFPIKDHGAIEIGEPRFCHRENGKDDCGTFKFAMIWRKNGDS